MTPLIAAVLPAVTDVIKRFLRSRHFWVAGWRPSVAWVCVAALFYTYLVIPFAQFYFAINGMEVDLPKLNTGEMMPILMGMLGLGAYRTYEKKLKLTK